MRPSYEDFLSVEDMTMDNLQQKMDHINRRRIDVLEDQVAHLTKLVRKILKEAEKDNFPYIAKCE